MDRILLSPALWTLILCVVGSSSLRADIDATYLGSPVPLNGTWRFHAGDDPSFAKPDFDDNSWSRVTVPGGWPGVYSKAGWFRTKVRLSPAAIPPDGLGVLLQDVGARWTELEIVNGAYEVYANGCKVGGWGTVPPSRPNYPQNPNLVIIPRECIGDQGQLVVAIRLWRDPAVARAFPREGGLIVAPVLGNVGTMQDALRTAVERTHISYLARYLLYFVCFVVGLVGLRLFLLQPERREYGLFAAFLFLSAFRPALTLVQSFTNWIDDRTSVWLWYMDTVLVSVVGIEFALALVGRRVPRFLRVLQIIFVATAVARGFAPQPDPIWSGVKIMADITMVITTIVVVILAFRAGRKDAWPIGIALLFMALPFIAVVLDPLVSGTNVLQLVMGSSFFIGPFRLQLHYPGTLLFAGTVALVLTRRFTQDARARDQLEAEMTAAREVQDLLLSNQAEAPGFRVETSYLPAAELGGDFFQLLPGDDGGLLVVVGDVSGKGLRAAMIVGVVIGAIRTATNRAPAPLLAHINQALAGRSGEGFVTCCVCALSPAGKLTAANAGHIVPYLNGKPLELPSGLPLGIVRGIDWEEAQFQLSPGARLVLLSDGVVEAKDSNGVLLGFDGLEAALKDHGSAVGLAQYAREFGQEDDITVVGIQRT